MEVTTQRIEWYYTVPYVGLHTGGIPVIFRGRGLTERFLFCSANRRRACVPTLFCGFHPAMRAVRSPDEVFGERYYSGCKPSSIIRPICGLRPIC
jgi:hypothetical protein